MHNAVPLGWACPMNTHKKFQTLFDMPSDMQLSHFTITTPYLWALPSESGHQKYSWADNHFSGKAIVHFHEPVTSWYSVSPHPADLLGPHWKEAVVPHQCDHHHWRAWGQSDHPEETKRESIITGMNMITDNWMVYSCCKIIITWVSQNHYYPTK